MNQRTSRHSTIALSPRDAREPPHAAHRSLTTAVEQRARMRLTAACSAGLQVDGRRPLRLITRPRSRPTAPAQVQPPEKRHEAHASTHGWRVAAPQVEASSPSTRIGVFGPTWGARPARARASCKIGMFCGLWWHYLWLCLGTPLPGAAPSSPPHVTAT